MILGRYPLITMRMDLDFSENIIIGDKETHEGCLTPMVNLINYNFK